MSKLIVTFNDIEKIESDNGYEKETIKKWTEDGDWAALAEIISLERAYDIKLEEDK